MSEACNRHADSHTQQQRQPPAATILFAESASSADYIMPHFWMSLADATDVDALRHRRNSNYTFVDGHSRLLPLKATYAPPEPDWWNPLP